MKRAQSRVDRIMEGVYERAFKVLEAEVRAFMHSDHRFVEYVHAVGWGPVFVKDDGNHVTVSDEMPTKRGRDTLEFCEAFYDVYGASNERVKP